MLDFTHRFTSLYQRWISGLATSDEVDELAIMLEEPGAQQLLSPLMKSAWEQQNGQQDMPEETFKNIAKNIITKNKDLGDMPAPIVHRVHFLRTAWFRYAAAIIIVFGAALYIFTKQKSADSMPTIAQQQDVPAPTTDQATLTLANGQRINIDGSATGQLAKEGNTAIERNAAGEIIYDNTSGKSANIQFNILTVPRGGRMATILLSDGTRVYLNSASSLKYPVQFSTKERRVELIGEAYFEVASNPNAAFLVSDGKTITQVLGTSFNIDAYPDDDAEGAITLISGAVKVSNNEQSAVLKPGEQCLTQNNSLITTSQINIDEVIAWKNGYFHFEKATLNTIAKEVARWYNVDFIFENKHAATETFYAKFSRNSSLSELLKILELSDVKVEIKGNEVIIK